MTLRGYLNAPAEVQEAFDKLVLEAVKRETELENSLWEDYESDPHFDPDRARRNSSRGHDAGLGVSWTTLWHRRANPPKAKPGQPQPYHPDSDPLLTLNLREAWPMLTGEDVPQFGNVRCPNPEHGDRFPSCSVRDVRFRCFGCGANGRIIDLGSLLYGIEATGEGYHRIRQALMADLGMQEAA